MVFEQHFRVERQYNIRFGNANRSRYGNDYLQRSEYSWLFEYHSGFCKHNRDHQHSTSCANYFCWSNHLLSRRVGELECQQRCQLPLEQWCNHSNYFSNKLRCLYRDGHQYEWMFNNFSSCSSYGQCLAKCEHPSRCKRQCLCGFFCDAQHRFGCCLCLEQRCYYTDHFCGRCRYFHRYINGF